MSRENLLSTLDESERIFENLSQNELERIARMQNLSHNELKQITKMQNLSQNKLEQIAKMRHIKNHNNMSREELLIKSKSNNTEIEDTRKNSNEIRNKFSKSKIKENGEKLNKIKKGLKSKKKQTRQKTTR